MRVIFFVLAALVLAAVAAQWSEGVRVAGDGGASLRSEVSERASSVALESVPDVAPRSPQSGADAPEASQRVEASEAASRPPPLVPGGDPVGSSEAGPPPENDVDAAPVETVLLAEPAAFPEEVPPAADSAGPEEVATTQGERARVRSRESAPFDPDWSAALVRRLLALHRTLSE